MPFGGGETEGGRRPRGRRARAFGEPQATDDETCLYPLQLLRYADVDVLVSQIGEPGEACHGCEATLSATVLKRVPGGAKRLRSFPSFAKGGTFGAVASVTAIAIGGDDGIAIESGGLFQGYASSALDLYAFRPRGLVHLDAGAPLIIEGDNSGAETDASKTITVESAWSLAGGELTIDYRVADARGKSDSRAVWSVGETTLTLKSGAPPKRWRERPGRNEAGRSRFAIPLTGMAVPARGALQGRRRRYTRWRSV